MKKSYLEDNATKIDVDEKVDKDLSKLITPWMLPQPKKLCFKDCSIVDVINGKLNKHASVITENGIITSVKESTADIPDDVFQLDCKGKYLCPGLFDNHVHLLSVPGETDLSKQLFMAKDKAMTRVGHNTKAMLKRGFTSVRDCGGTSAFVKNAIKEGSLHGPRLFISGHAISQTGGHGHLVPADLPGESFDSCACHLNLLGVVADGVDQCYKAAREELRLGADFIKIMAGGGVASPTDHIENLQYCEDEIRALVRISENNGTYISAHAYTPASIKRCVENGVKGIEHGNLLDDETAKLIAQKDCYLTPTLVTYKIMASNQFKGFLDEPSQEKNFQVLSKGLDSLLLAKRYSVKICFGTDLLGSLVGYQTQEFFIRSKVLTPQEILLSATVTPAEMNGVADLSLIHI